jgi:uncharacterized protein (DUF433 family)
MKGVLTSTATVSDFARDADGAIFLAERIPMVGPDAVLRSDPAIIGGTPVFVGTRVPLRTLLDYLEAGDPLSEFLEDFPTVSRELAIAAITESMRE